MSDPNPYAPPQFPAGKGSPSRPIPRRVKAWLLAIGLCYAVSLPLPAIYGIADGPYPGIACLALVPYVLIYPAWYANIFLFYGMFVLASARPRRALVLGSMATVAALSLPLMNVFEAWRFLGIGYYFWLASMVMLVLAARDRITQARLEEYAEA